MSSGIIKKDPVSTEKCKVQCRRAYKNAKCSVEGPLLCAAFTKRRSRHFTYEKFCGRGQVRRSGKRCIYKSNIQERP